MILMRKTVYAFVKAFCLDYYTIFIIHNNIEFAPDPVTKGPTEKWDTPLRTVQY